MSERYQQHEDPCEWNPTENRAAYDDEVHAAAEVIVGSNGRWRLCSACAGLPEFKKLRARKSISPLTPKAEAR